MLFLQKLFIHRLSNLFCLISFHCLLKAFFLHFLESNYLLLLKKVGKNSKSAYILFLFFELAHFESLNIDEVLLLDAKRNVVEKLVTFFACFGLFVVILRRLFKLLLTHCQKIHVLILQIFLHIFLVFGYCFFLLLRYCIK